MRLQTRNERFKINGHQIDALRLNYVMNNKKININWKYLQKGKREKELAGKKKLTADALIT